MAFYGTLGDIDLVSTDYPSIQPTLDLNFAKTKALDPRITFYRNSLATYTDDKGIVRTVPENVPRFDHDPTTGESLGLLIEESRTNLLTYSTNFNDSSWTKTTSDRVVANQAIAPDGTNTASKFKETLSGAVQQHSTYVIRSGTAQTLTFSVFVKAAERSKVFLQHSNFETAAAAATFDLTNGIAVASATNADYTFINAYSVAYGNGWYRCILTATKSTSTTYNIPLISIHNGTTFNYIGDGTSGIYIWGAQLEVAAFPTSYIPTSGSTVTRAQDIVEMTGTNFSSWYTQTEGTVSAIYRGGKTSVLPAGYGRIAQTQQWSLEVNGPTTGRAFGVLSTGAYNNILGLTDSWTTISKYAAAWSNSTFNAHASEGVLGTVTGNTTFSNTSTSITFGASVNGQYGLNGHLSRFTFYPKKLTNTQLQNLTS